MQRHSSFSQAKFAAGLSGVPGLNQGARPDPRNPITGVYGAGLIDIFTTTRNFVVKPGQTKLRVRGISPRGTASADGGTISFGAFCSITGGKSPANGGGGGVATGWDINYDGGAADGPAGGAAANLFGPGDRVGGTGGNARPGKSGITGKGGQLTGDYSVSGGIPGGNGDPGITDVLDYLGTGGGGSAYTGNAAVPAGNGANGGGGGSGNGATGAAPGKGGFPGGGDASNSGGCGGGGFGLKEISGLVPGQVILVTVPADGIIIVES